MSSNNLPLFFPSILEDDDVVIQKYLHRDSCHPVQYLIPELPNEPPLPSFY